MDENAAPHPIVVGYDGSSQAHDALALGAALASATGEPLVIAGAYGPTGVVRDDELDARRAQVLERLDEAATALAAKASFEVERRAVPGRSAAAALQELAETEHPRALVLGSSHRGPIGRVLMGGVAERLLHGSPCPVAVAPRGLAERGPVNLATICVGFDGGPEGWTALQRAAQLATAAGARLRVALAVSPLTGTPQMPMLPPGLVEARLHGARTELDRAVHSVGKRLEAEPRLLRGEPVQQLTEEASRGVDLLVLGSRGYGTLRRVLLGGVSAAVMRSAPCPVMVVPRTAEFDPSGEGLAGEDELVASG